MRKKIAIVQPALAPYNRERFEELAKDKNLEIVLFIENRASSHGPDWNMTDVKGCQVEIIDSHIKKEMVVNTEQGYVTESIRMIPYSLSVLLLKYRPHIVLVCNATELLFAYPLKYVLKFKIGLIVEDTIHAVSNKTIIQKRLKSFLYKKADFYLAFSNDAVEYLKNININNFIFRSSWSIDILRFSNPDKTQVEQIKNQYELHNKLTFITVSRLDPAKGILNFLKALKELPLEFLNKIAYLIVGSGPQYDEISSFIRVNNMKSVYLVGYKKYAEIVDYYHAADIFILPTFKDLFSLTVMEAMASGLPVLTTIYNGARELIEEGKNGYIFDSKNIEDIKKNIIRIYQNRKWLKKMGKVSIEIIKDYSHQKVIKNLKSVLERF